MGFWGSDKRVYEDIPDEQLDWNQQQYKKWRSRDPFHTDAGSTYLDDGKRIIDARLNASLGLNDIDDLFQMKAPRFYNIYTKGIESLNNLCNYVADNLPANNTLQQLQGKYDELQKRCEDQKAMIEKLMAQNETLQNQLLKKVNARSSSFSR